MIRIWRLALGMVILGLCGWFSTAPLSAHHSILDGVSETNIVLPANFMARTVVSNLTLPTDMVVLPSGDLLITEKGTGGAEFSKANVRYVRAGVLQPEPALTLGVNSEKDSGLLSIILDPQFANNRYFYLWYSTGEGSLGWEGTTYNRLSRFVFDPTTGKADPASETIILDKLTWGEVHNGGGLVFDNMGNLLITTGDAGSSFTNPALNLAQNMRSLNGKVLRIRPRSGGGYDVPGDNPFVGNSEGFLAEIYAAGFRNPFRIERRAADQQFYLIEVGQDTWEEVNLLQAGANYGWPYREGRCAIAEREANCTPTPPQFTDPTLVYAHPAGGGAGITAMTFYEGTAWPEEYRGRLFFADFNSSWIGTFDLNQPAQAFQTFGTSVGALVDMEAVTEGIYTVSIYDQSVKFIYYDADGNQPPTASLTVSPNSGQAPLRVNFVARATDVDNRELFYHWDFGNGVTRSTDQPTTSYVYPQDGTYLATLQVRDGDDGRSQILSEVIEVFSGEMPRIELENLTEPGRTLYHGGDELRFTVTRTVGTVGLDVAAPYAWTILQHHNEHAHIVAAGVISDGVSLDIETEPHALGASIWYEIEVAMRTNTGQVIRTSYELQPETSTLQLQSWPAPSVLYLSRMRVAPQDLTTVIVGQEYLLEAPESIIHNGQVGEFEHWLVVDSWPVASAAAVTTTIPSPSYALVAPVEAKSYIAFYTYVRDASLSYMPTVRNDEVAAR